MSVQDGGFKKSDDKINQSATLTKQQPGSSIRLLFGAKFGVKLCIGNPGVRAPNRSPRRPRIEANSMFPGTPFAGAATMRRRCPRRHRRRHSRRGRIGGLIADGAPACSRQTSDDRGAARKFDPIAIRIEDHRYPGHVSKCYRCKTFAHALGSQLAMHSVDVGDLQGDVAPTGRLTNRIDGRSSVFLEEKQTIAQAKGRTARPGLLGKAENITIKSPVFAQASDPHRDS
jgi:hypothetical protein